MVESYVRRLLDGELDELLEQLPALMIVGPRAAGKTTTMRRRAKSVVKLDEPAQAAAFQADADAALRGLDEPVLLDEWQAVPEVFGATRRAVNEDDRPNRFYLTGSVRAELENEAYPGTGRVQRLRMYPLSVREQVGNLSGETLSTGSLPGFRWRIRPTRPTFGAISSWRCGEASRRQRCA